MYIIVLYVLLLGLTGLLLAWVLYYHKNFKELKHRVTTAVIGVITIGVVVLIDRQETKEREAIIRKANEEIAKADANIKALDDQLRQMGITPPGETNTPPTDSDRLRALWAKKLGAVKPRTGGYKVQINNSPADTALAALIATLYLDLNIPTEKDPQTQQYLYVGLSKELASAILAEFQRLGRTGQIIAP